MIRKNGFTLVELLISIIIASIIVLTAGVLSNISLNAYYKELSKQQTFNDLSYGLKLIRNRFRNAEAASVRNDTPAANVWTGQPLLEIGNAAFGIYQANNTSPREFVYLADKIDPNKREVLFTVPDNNLTWTVECVPSCPSPMELKVVIKGTKNKNPFHMETTIARRNP